MKNLLALVCIVSALSSSAFATGIECWLDITYKGQPSKTVHIPLDQQIGEERNFKKTSDGLVIEIVLNHNYGSVDVLEANSGLHMTATGNQEVGPILTFSRDEYKALVMCAENPF